MFTTLFKIACECDAFISRRRKQILYEPTRWTMKINSSKAAADFFRSIWDNGLIGEQEMLYLVLVNEKCQPIYVRRMHIGGMDRVPMDMLMIFHLVYEHKAPGLFIAHNHPRGKCTPSAEDISITSKFYELCTALNVTLHDHIIICPQKGKYLSFREEGLLV